MIQRKPAPGIRNFIQMAVIALAAALAVSINSALAISGSLVKVEGNLVQVETRTMKAIIDRGLIISLVRKSDSRELIKAQADNKPALQLIYPKAEAVSLGHEPGDRCKTIQINNNQPIESIINSLARSTVSLSMDSNRVFIMFLTSSWLIFIVLSPFIFQLLHLCFMG